MEIILWTLLTVKKVPFHQEGLVNFWITDTDFSILDISGDLRQGSSNNSVTNFVLGFSYMFQRETQPSFEDLLLVVLVILRRRFATWFWPKVSVFNFAISEQYFRFSIWSTRTTVSILYSKDRENFQDIESKWLFSLNYTSNQWCWILIQHKISRKR